MLALHTSLIVFTEVENVGALCPSPAERTPFSELVESIMHPTVHSWTCREWALGRERSAVDMRGMGLGKGRTPYKNSTVTINVIMQTKHSHHLRI